MQTVFIVETGTQSPAVNRLLSAADLASGAVVPDGDGYKVTVEWDKRVRVITRERVDLAAEKLKEVFEQLGFVGVKVREDSK